MLDFNEKFCEISDLNKKVRLSFDFNRNFCKMFDFNKKSFLEFIENFLK